MRMNKYRAWVKSEKRYIVDVQDFIPLIVTNKGVMKLQPQFEKNYYEILPLDWFIIEQSTGLHDKNGVEIYEGDVVSFGNIGFGNRKVFAEVKMNDGCFDVVNDVFRDYLKCYVANKSVEVIGNIHERSEDNDK